MNKILSTVILGLGMTIAMPVFAAEHSGHEAGHQGGRHEGSGHFESHSSGYNGHYESHWHGTGRRWSSRHWEGNHWVYIYPDVVPYIGMINPDDTALIWACGPYGHCRWVARY